ncbi:MAG: diguanylate cyclase [Acidobacteriota bacterium]
MALVCVAAGPTAAPQRPAAPAVQPLAPAPLTFLSDPDLPPARLPFRSYGGAEGLTNLVVRRLAQDAVGFLWVATEDGLFRYDGQRFQRFGLEEGLPASWITALATPPSGGVWVGTPQGVARLVEDRFVGVGREVGLPAAGCNDLAVDGAGRLWVALTAGLFVGGGGAPFALAPGWSGGEATALEIGAAGDEIWAAQGGRVGRLRPPLGWSFAELAPRWGEAVEELTADAGGTLWVQSARHLFALVPGASAFMDLTGELPRVSSRGFIARDRSGRLWVPTDEGISFRERGRWVSLGAASGLPTDWSRCIMEDREGSIWVGSLGLHRLIGRGMWASWTRAEGLRSDVIWCVYRDRKGQLWVGADKGLMRATRTGWRVLPGTEETVVRSVWEAADGMLWLGCVPAEVRRFDPRTGAIVRFGRQEGVTGRRVLSVRGDRRGELWAATDGAGLLRFVPATGSFAREDAPEGTPNESFRCLLEDRQGRLWATGEQGLLCREAGRWQRFTRRDGLLRDHVAYLTETASGELWIAYFESLGIARLRVIDGGLEVRERRDRDSGLASNKIYLLGEDSGGRLWVGSGNGVDLQTPAGVLHFSQGDGLAGNDCDAMAFLAEPAGHVFIGTSSGLSFFHGSPEPQGGEPPRACLLSARLGDRPRRLHQAAPLVVPHDENTFEVSFSGLSFVNEDHVQHEVRLLGIEPEWRRSHLREARYTHLPPGAYGFEVRARLGEGEWSRPAAFAFVVSDPWWGTWPARVLGVLLLAGAIVLVVRMRIHRLRRRTGELETIVAARTRELAEANRELSEASVTDPLTGSKNRRFLTLSLPEEVARIERTYRGHRAQGLAGAPRSIDLLFLLVDIDHFKEVNDRFGHEAGDRLLQLARERLTRAARSSDTVVRWGGEEFLVVARGCEPDEAPVLAERIRTMVGDDPFDLGGGRSVRRSCSLGFAALPFLITAPELFSWEDVVNLADCCLYAAKRSGRNAWVGVVATATGAATDAAWRDRILHELPQAIAGGEAALLTSLPSGTAVHWE